MFWFWLFPCLTRISFGSPVRVLLKVFLEDWCHFYSPHRKLWSNPSLRGFEVIFLVQRFYHSLALAFTGEHLVRFKIVSYLSASLVSLQGPHQRNLLKNLLKDYNRMERPVGNDSHPLTVVFTLSLIQIMDVVSVCSCSHSQPHWPPLAVR